MHNCKEYLAQNISLTSIASARCYIIHICVLKFGVKFPYTSSFTASFVKCLYAIREQVPLTVQRLLFLSAFPTRHSQRWIPRLSQDLRCLCWKPRKCFFLSLMFRWHRGEAFTLFSCITFYFAALPLPLLLLLINNVFLPVLVLFTFYRLPRFDYDRLTGFYAWSAMVNVSACCMRPLEKLAAYWYCSEAFTMRIDWCVSSILEKGFSLRG